MLQGAKCGHGCCAIDEHRMIILGGYDKGKVLSSGFVYDARSEQSAPLPSDMPAARYFFTAVANERFMYAIGGKDADGRAVNTLFRLSFETYEWTTMAPMWTARSACAGVLLGDYLYIFGGLDDDGALASVERYSIVGNTWEDLPDMAAERSHCPAAALRNEIYILDGFLRTLEVFDTALLEWRTEASPCDMPRERIGAAAVALKNRYLVVIGGEVGARETAGCLIYDSSINQWSSTPVCMNMITARDSHTAALLDGKIVVAGGYSDGQRLSSVECVDARDVLEYAPLDYPLPYIYFSQVLQLGKALLVTKHA